MGIFDAKTPVGRSLNSGHLSTALEGLGVTTEDLESDPGTGDDPVVSGTSLTQSPGQGVTIAGGAFFQPYSPPGTVGVSHSDGEPVSAGTTQGTGLARQSANTSATDEVE